MRTTLQKESRATNDRPTEFVAPEVNIFETKEGYVLEAEMPGVSKEGLEITLEGNELTIVGHRNNESTNGEALFRERRLSDYRRVIPPSRAAESRRK